MRIVYHLLIYGLMIAFLLGGCSSPGEKQLRAKAETFSENIDNITGIDIIAILAGGQPQPLELPYGANQVVVIGSVEPGKDQQDFSRAKSELSRMLRKPSNVRYDTVTRLWLRIRFKNDNRAYYCMYDHNSSFLFFALKGPIDMKSQVNESEWKEDGITVKSSRKFREIINKYIPSEVITSLSGR